MGLLDIASIRSIERGFNYYQSECVINNHFQKRSMRLK